jgi:hypothetical protein
MNPQRRAPKLTNEAITASRSDARSLVQIISPGGILKYPPHLTSSEVMSSTEQKFSRLPFVLKRFFCETLPRYGPRCYRQPARRLVPSRRIPERGCTWNPNRPLRIPLAPRLRLNRLIFRNFFAPEKIRQKHPIRDRSAWTSEHRPRPPSRPTFSASRIRSGTRARDFPGPLAGGVWNRFGGFD